MARLLTAARVSVSERAEPEYLQTVARLAARLSGRGTRLWLFRSADDPRAFLEFRECGWPGTPAPVTDEERSLDGRLRELAVYAEADRHWHEVVLPAVKE
jgi:hypothetical protein